jgi:hypothetical protein
MADAGDASCYRSAPLTQGRHIADLRPSLSVIRICLVIACLSVRVWFVVEGVVLGLNALFAAGRRVELA